MAKTEYFIGLSDGKEIKISELDYNNLKGRIARGSHNGWYKQRGPSVGDQKNFNLQFKYIAGIWTTGDEPSKDDGKSSTDVGKRLPPEPGKKEAPDVSCHDWNQDDTWDFVAQNVGGMMRYYKQCKHCGAKSTLIKKREVEIYMGEQGLTLEDVPMVE